MKVEGSSHVHVLRSSPSWPFGQREVAVPYRWGRVRLCKRYGVICTATPRHPGRVWIQCGNVLVLLGADVRKALGPPEHYDAWQRSQWDACPAGGRCSGHFAWECELCLDAAARAANDRAPDSPPKSPAAADSPPANPPAAVAAAAAAAQAPPVPAVAGAGAPASAATAGPPPASATPPSPTPSSPALASPAVRLRLCRLQP